ncbi:hypothetical protein [Pontibacter harenae]|uniref:hypothetical protein n=1 Tax=Pontibacter harenae TaxID=2894083 RepID=UPI001E3EF3C4|nr:hypothetical protein [Pontibacter harenae]MCC9166043.1 hypothetical protein [Pontibacter harenae]
MKNKDKPTPDTNSQPMPEEYSNTANHKGAIDLGTDGTKATASQQQGQGAWASKDHENTGDRNGSRKSSGGQGGNSKTGE